MGPNRSHQGARAHGALIFSPRRGVEINNDTHKLYSSRFIATITRVGVSRRTFRRPRRHFAPRHGDCPAQPPRRPRVRARASRARLHRARARTGAAEPPEPPSEPARRAVDRGRVEMSRAQERTSSRQHRRERAPEARRARHRARVLRRRAVVQDEFPARAVRSGRDVREARAGRI